MQVRTFLEFRGGTWQNILVRTLMHDWKFEPNIEESRDRMQTLKNMALRTYNLELHWGGAA